MSQVFVHFQCKPVQVCRFIFKLDKPFVVRFAFALFNHGCHGKFGDVHAFFFGGFDEAIFHFFANNMFAKGGNEMLDTPGHHYAVWVGRNKFYGIADIISPKTRIAVYDQRVVFSHLHIFQAKPCGIGVKNFVGGNKFKKDSAVGI